MQDCTTCRHSLLSYKGAWIAIVACGVTTSSPIKARLIRIRLGQAEYMTENGARLPVHPCPCWEESGVSAMERCALWGVEAQEDDGWE
jgi:hypothetical protein